MEYGLVADANLSSDEIQDLYSSQFTKGESDDDDSSIYSEVQSPNLFNLPETNKKSQKTLCSNKEATSNAKGRKGILC